MPYAVSRHPRANGLPSQCWGTAAPGSTACAAFAASDGAVTSGLAAWKIDSVPAGWNAAFAQDPSPIVPGTSFPYTNTTMVVAVPSSAAPGSYPVEATATFGDGVTVQDIVTVAVAGSPSTAVSCPSAPASLSGWQQFSAASLGSTPSFLATTPSGMFLTSGTKGSVATLSQSGAIAFASRFTSAAHLTYDSGQDAVWVTSTDAASTIRFRPETPTSRQAFVLPTAVAAGVATDLAGDVLITDFNNSRVIELSSSGTPLRTYATATKGAHPTGIALGDDGNIWFTETSAGKIARLSPWNGNAVTEFSGFSSPFAITMGSDGNLWVAGGAAWRGFGSTAAPAIYKVSLSGVIRAKYTAGLKAGADPFDLHEDVGTGLLWFSEEGASAVGSLTMATGVIANYAMPSAKSGPMGLTFGPDQRLWATEYAVNKVAAVAVPTPVPGCIAPN